MNPTQSYIDTMISRADMAKQESQIQDAIQWYQMCILTLQSSETLPKDYRCMHLYTNLGECYALNGSIECARNVLNVAFRINVYKQDYVECSRILLKMGLILEEYDLDDEALQHYQAGLQILEMDPSDNYIEKMELYSTQGACLYVMDRDGEAIQNYKEALAFARKSMFCSHQTISTLVFNIVELLKDGGFISEAIDVFETSLALDCIENDRHRCIQTAMETTVRCAELYDSLSNPHDAVRVATMGINLFEQESRKTGNVRHLGSYYARLTFICGVNRLRLRETQLALESFSISLRVSKLLYQDAFVYKQFDMDSINQVYDQLLLLNFGNDNYSCAASA